MMDKCIFIPSYKRPEKLLRTLSGLTAISDIHIYVLFSNDDRESFDIVGTNLSGENKNITLAHYKEPKNLVEKMNTFLFMCNPELSLVLSDDLIFNGTQISDAFKYYEENFPDGNTLMGLASMTTRASVSGINNFSYVMAGRKFINRFPDRKMWCPAYTHYRFDKELYEYAVESNSWHFFEHPDVFTHDMLDTSGGSSADGYTKQNYKNIYADRQARGALWGRNFII